MAYIYPQVKERSYGLAATWTSAQHPTHAKKSLLTFGVHPAFGFESTGVSRKKSNRAAPMVDF